MAALHAGVLQLSCADCQDAPGFKESQGCEEPTQAPVWEDGDGDEYYNCPVKWITDDIVEWYQQLTYDTEFHCALPYDQQANKYIDAWIVYKRNLIRFQKENSAKETDKTGDSLENLKAGFNSR